MGLDPRHAARPSSRDRSQVLQFLPHTSSRQNGSGGTRAVKSALDGLHDPCDHDHGLHGHGHGLLDCDRGHGHGLHDPCDYDHGLHDGRDSHGGGDHNDGNTTAPTTNIRAPTSGRSSRTPNNVRPRLRVEIP